MFTSYEFIIFMLALFVFYYIIPKKWQWCLLLFASFAFYYTAGKWYPIFITITAITIYVTAEVIGWLDTRAEVSIKKVAGTQESPFGRKEKNNIQQIEIKELTREERKAQKNALKRKKKIILIICLLVNLGILAALKYSNFVIDNINRFIHESEKELSYTEWILPMGISFYTFQAIGYLLDVYWGKMKPQKNFFRFLLFISFFPQLIQGPISRYGDLCKTLYKEHKPDWKQIKFGLERICWGYFKKLVIADRIAVAVGVLSEESEYYTGAWVIVLMLFYAVQLYGDFTGGIDITIGIAQVLGIRMEENFIRPFFSKNIAEYWRRWHISMGTWFRDYVFYPCSISRPLKAITSFCKKHFGKQAARRVSVYISTVLVWLATGIWHGAAWSFVAWGLTNGVIILLSEELTPLYKKFHNQFPSIDKNQGYKVFQVFRTFCLLCCIRLFDNYGGVKITIKQFVHMFTKFWLHPISQQELLDLGLAAGDYLIVAVGVLLMFAVSFFGRKESVREQISRKPYTVKYAVYMVLILTVILFGKYGITYDARQFIYNQF